MRSADLLTDGRRTIPLFPGELELLSHLEAFDLRLHGNLAYVSEQTFDLLVSRHMQTRVLDYVDGHLFPVRSVSLI